MDPSSSDSNESVSPSIAKFRIQLNSGKHDETNSFNFNINPTVFNTAKVIPIEEINEHSNTTGVIESSSSKSLENHIQKSVQFNDNVESVNIGVVNVQNVHNSTSTTTTVNNNVVTVDTNDSTNSNEKPSDKKKKPIAFRQKSTFLSPLHKPPRSLTLSRATSAKLTHARNSSTHNNNNNNNNNDNSNNNSTPDPVMLRDHHRSFSELPLANINLLAVRNVLKQSPSITESNQTNYEDLVANNSMNNSTYLDATAIADHNLSSSFLSAGSVADNDEIESIASYSSFNNSNLNSSIVRPAHTRALSFDSLDQNMLKYSAILSDLISVTTNNNNLHVETEEQSDITLAAKIGQNLLEKNNMLIDENHNIKTQLQLLKEQLIQLQNSSPHNNSMSNSFSSSFQNNHSMSFLDEKQLQSEIGLDQEESVYDFIRRELVTSANNDSNHNNNKNYSQNSTEIATINTKKFRNLNPQELTKQYKQFVFHRIKQYKQSIMELESKILNYSSISDISNNNSDNPNNSPSLNDLHTELSILRKEKDLFQSKIRDVEISHLSDTRRRLKELRIRLTEEFEQKSKPQPIITIKRQLKPLAIIPFRTIKINIECSSLPYVTEEKGTSTAVLIGLFTKPEGNDKFNFGGRTDKQNRLFLNNKNTEQILFNRAITLRQFITNQSNMFRFSIFDVRKANTSTKEDEVTIGVIAVDSYTLLTALTNQNELLSPINKSEKQFNFNQRNKRVSKELLKSVEKQEIAANSSIRKAELVFINTQNQVNYSAKVVVTMTITPPLDEAAYPRHPLDEPEYIEETIIQPPIPEVLPLPPINPVINPIVAPVETKSEPLPIVTKAINTVAAVITVTKVSMGTQTDPISPRHLTISDLEDHKQLPSVSLIQNPIQTDNTNIFTQTSNSVNVIHREVQQLNFNDSGSLVSIDNNQVRIPPLVFPNSMETSINNSTNLSTSVSNEGNNSNHNNTSRNIADTNSECGSEFSVDSSSSALIASLRAEIEDLKSKLHLSAQKYLQLLERFNETNSSNNNTNNNSNNNNNTDNGNNNNTVISESGIEYLRSSASTSSANTPRSYSSYLLRNEFSYAKLYSSVYSTQQANNNSNSNSVLELNNNSNNNNTRSNDSITISPGVKLTLYFVIHFLIFTQLHPRYPSFYSFFPKSNR